MDSGFIHFIDYGNIMAITNERKIILITDIIDQKVRKEKEIEFYEKELKKIEEKLFFLRKEQQLTQFIIDIIEQEKVVDIREQMYERLESQTRVDTDDSGWRWAYYEGDAKTPDYAR